MIRAIGHRYGHAKYHRFHESTQVFDDNIDVMKPISKLIQLISNVAN